MGNGWKQSVRGVNKVVNANETMAGADDNDMIWRGYVVLDGCNPVRG